MLLKKELHERLIGQDVTLNLPANFVVVSITRQDLIFDDRACSMVVLQDLTMLAQFESERKFKTDINNSVFCMAQEIKSSLKFIDHFCDILLAGCSERQKVFLTSIRTTTQMILF